MDYNEIYGYKQLDEIFSTLPELDVEGAMFKPYFDYGSHEDLLRRLKDNRKIDVKYPLIWLQNPYTLRKVKQEPYWVKAEMTLILATLTSRNASNKERVNETMEKVLEPLHNNVIRALNYSGITKIEDYDDEVYFNYGPTETESTDIWDAIKIDIEISFKTGNCKIKNINY